MRAALPLMKNVLTPLAKSVLMLLALTKAVSATDTSIQKKTFGWGRPSDLLTDYTDNFKQKNGWYNENS